jgi:hypothetical protein
MITSSNRQGREDRQDFIKDAKKAWRLYWFLGEHGVLAVETIEMLQLPNKEATL